MEDGSDQNAYLKTLLGLGDLEIRKLSRGDLTLRVGDYFKAVEKFINRVPLIIEAITKVATQKAADYDFRSIKDVKPFMEDIAYYKYLLAFDEITRANTRGHTKFSTDRAKEILGDLSKFCNHITYIKKELGIMVRTEGKEPIPESYKALFLKDAIVMADNAETTRRMRILVVDDSPVALKTIHSVLDSDYDVFGIANPASVEPFLQRVAPDLFLLDYKMPGISGFELVPIIRNFPEHKSTPIIFLTAMGTQDYVSTALALGACDYIVKPFQGDSLLTKVAKHISRKKV